MINKLLQHKILVGLAALLFLYGLVKPDISSLVNTPSKNIVVNTDLNVQEPSDSVLKDACLKVVEAIKNGSGNKKTDALKLCSLYRDLADLIQIDGEDQVVKSTLEIREANKLAGKLSSFDLKGKYPNLATAANNVVVAGIGDDEAVLDEKLRRRAVETFRALSWACYEGSK